MLVEESDMARIISATYHAEKQIAEFVCDDGRRCFRIGGKLPWRINNPGDLSSPLSHDGQPAPKLTQGFVGYANATNSSHFFFIFPDEHVGWRELKASLRRKYSNSTIPQIVPVYAPAHENNTEKYISDALKLTGLKPTHKVSDMSDSELEKLAHAIGTIEGFFGDPDTQKEVWIDSTTLAASDGTRPIPEAVLQLVSGGKTKDIKADQHGEFAPILHLDKTAPIEVKARDRHGKSHAVGKLDANKSGRHRAVHKSLAVRGVAAPHAAAGAPQRSRIPFKYLTRPGDSLELLAQLFEIAPEQIARDNDLKSSKLLPSQELWIYGRAPAKPEFSSPDPGWFARMGTEIHSWFSRSDAGAGHPLGLFDAKPVRAPWMLIALREAKLFAGKEESDITKTHNYHRLVTDTDRAGGRTKEQRKADNKPQWDGLSTLAGDHNPWCAAFINYCLKESGYPTATKFESSYGFGEDKTRFKKIDKPVYGAIRFTRRDGGGHVCFVYGEIDSELVVLGGNQNDQIMFEHPPTSKGLSYYIPISYAPSKQDEMIPDVDTATLKQEFSDAVKKGLKPSTKQN